MFNELPHPKIRLQEKVQVIYDRLEVGYLGDMLSTAGGCELSTTHSKPPGRNGDAACSFIPPRLLLDS